jgi:hypothetical protein
MHKNLIYVPSSQADVFDPACRGIEDQLYEAVKSKNLILTRNLIDKIIKLNCCISVYRAEQICSLMLVLSNKKSESEHWSMLLKKFRDAGHTGFTIL